MTTTREETHRQPAVFPAPIYRHGAAGYSTGAYGCSGKSPPGAVLLNGRWTEASTGNGAGYAAPGPYGAVIAPQGSGSRVW